MTASNQWTPSAVLLIALVLSPVAAEAEKVKNVSGLSGVQDGDSKQMLSLSPEAMDQVGRRDLLSVLKSPGKLILDNSRNVEGVTFTTQPYEIGYPYVCREDRVTLRYVLGSKYNEKGAWLDFAQRPAGVEAQPTYHIEQLPVSGFIPGTGYPAPKCDAQQPSASAAWFAAPNDTQAIRAANMFRMAEDEVKAGRLMPGPCDPHGTDTCSQWVLSLDDPSKIQSVEPCAPNSDGDACDVISFEDVDITIIGTIANDGYGFTPTSIKSVRVDQVIELET